MADEHRAEKVSSSALIPVKGNTFASMRSAADITSVEMSAPAFHRRFISSVVASGKVRDDSVVSNETSKRSTSIRKFTTGAQVRHKETGKKLTIINASIGYTKKSKTPVHKLADKNGNICQEKESNLILIL